MITLKQIKKMEDFNFDQIDFGFAETDKNIIEIDKNLQAYADTRSNENR